MEIRSHVCSLALVALSLMATIWLFGCGPARSSLAHVTSETSRSKEIRADAYLFEALIKRDGKPTTFQLEIYRTDTMLGVSGKGYLGKGALKGRVTADSLELYFPSTREYLYEAIADLADSSDCDLPVTTVNLLDLFRSLPDSVGLPAGIRLVADHTDRNKPTYVVSADTCDWQVELTYDLQNGSWRIREFTYRGGDGTSLRGRRIRYRADAGVKASRFTIETPPGTVRITR
jgi:hypothetical protein